MNYAPIRPNHNQARPIWQRYREWGLDPPMNWAEHVRDIIYATNMTIAQFILLANITDQTFDRLAGCTPRRYVPLTKTVAAILRLERMFDEEIKRYRTEPRLYNRGLRPGEFNPIRACSREEMGLLGADRGDEATSTEPDRRYQIGLYVYGTDPFVARFDKRADRRIQKPASAPVTAPVEIGDIPSDYLPTEPGQSDDGTVSAGTHPVYQ